MSEQPTDNSKQEDSKPAEEKKKEIKEIIIQLGRDTDISPQPIPQTLQVWEGANQLSKEYIEIMSRNMWLTQAIAKSLNEGPEVKDSLAKRSIALKLLIDNLLKHTFMDGYHKSGVLLELLMDEYMETAGNAKTIGLLQQLSQKAQLRAKMKTEGLIA